MVTGIRYRYRSIRTPRARAILRIQHEAARAIRQFLDEAGFVELLAPIIGPVTDPGIRGAAAVPIKFNGEVFTLMTSMILYKQMVMATLPRIYSFSPCVRLEPTASRGTGRHLAEFYQVDLEVARASCEQVMDVGDALLVQVLQAVRKECEPQLELLGRTLPLFSGSFPRVTFAEVVEMLRDEGIVLDSRRELPWKAEQILSQRFETPFWITEYPTGSRGFYYLTDPERPSLLRSFDFILPEGYGEIASGGEREHTLKGVIGKMHRTREKPAKYKWYIDMLREGIPPSAGFGIGLERLTRYLCGVPHIWECSPFPKVPGVI